MISEILKRYRAENGMTVQALAHTLGISEETVREYEAVETAEEAHYMFLPHTVYLDIQRLTGCTTLKALSYPETEENSSK